MTERERIKLGSKISSDGHYRDTFEVAGDPDRCAKVIRARRYARLQKWLIGHGVSPKLVGPQVPTFIVSLFRFGRTDLNTFELENIESLHEEFKEFVVQNAHLADIEGGGRAFVSDRVKNHDGTYSLTLAETGIVHNAPFWEHMEHVLALMKEHGQYFLSGPRNIMVQKVSETEWRPVFIDLKRLNYKPDMSKTDARYMRLLKTFRYGIRTKWSPEPSSPMLHQPGLSIPA